MTDAARRLISRTPFYLRKLVSDVLALAIYWPLACVARTAEALGKRVDDWPLSYYRGKGLYTMRTDALDRFGTVLEQRFSRAEIRAMMEQAGLENVRFSDDPPYWCAIGFKRHSNHATHTV
jgi:hypothetical protein